MCFNKLQTMKKIKKIVLVLSVIFVYSISNAQTDMLKRRVKHVVVIGFDGLSPDGLKNAKTPNFDQLIKEGASSMHARGVLPTSSSTNWATMIMGAGPEQHGITSNGWKVKDHVLPPVVEDDEAIFPTIFNVVNKQLPDAEIGVIYDWGDFGRLFEKSAVDYDVNPKTAQETAKTASAYIEDKKPTFAFVHLDHIDHAGHEFGHGSGEYYKSVEVADELLGEIMNAIKKAGMSKNTLVILSADHGGFEKGHGGETLGEIEIPFILWGKGIKKNYKIPNAVYQYDNAATVAFALGLKRPWAWIGRPLIMAFEGFEIDDPYPIVEKK